MVERTEMGVYKIIRECGGGSGVILWAIKVHGMQTAEQ